MKERLKKTSDLGVLKCCGAFTPSTRLVSIRPRSTGDAPRRPFYKFKERKLLKKQIDSMTNAESQAALDLAKKEEKERRKLKKLEKKVRDAVLKLNLKLKLTIPRRRASTRR